MEGGKGDGTMCRKYNTNIFVYVQLCVCMCVCVCVCVCVRVCVWLATIINMEK